MHRNGVKDSGYSEKNAPRSRAVTSLEKILFAVRAILLARKRLTLERFICVAREGIKDLTHRFVYAVLVSELRVRS
jgi:hypothetical protein